MFREAVSVFVLLGSLFLVPQESGPQDVTAKRLEKIREYLADAGDLYKQREFAKAGRKLESAMDMIDRAAREGSPANEAELATEYRRVARAHELLVAEGIELPALKPLPKPGEKVVDPASVPGPGGNGGASETQPVSFSADVVPILTRHCGTCHVQGSFGHFNMASYEKLMAALDQEAVVAGKPDDSLLIQSIESGDMPRRPQGGSGEFPEKDLETLKAWIASGAEFDGEDPAAPLRAGQGGRFR
jgi:hypothetical protein